MSLHEEWRSVVGFEGRYEVSNLGRLRSLSYRGHEGVVLMGSTPNYSGYHVVTLGANHIQRRLHCLVLEAFVGLRPKGMQGCHNDNNKNHNHLENLRWDTPKGNIADRRSYRGEDNPRAKLSNVDTMVIKDSRLSASLLAKVYEVSITRICQIRK